MQAASSRIPALLQPFTHTWHGMGSHLPAMALWSLAVTVWLTNLLQGAVLCCAVLCCAVLCAVRMESEAVGGLSSMCVCTVSRCIGHGHGMQYTFWLQYLALACVMHQVYRPAYQPTQ
jgi:hypothetical protein